MVKFTAYVNGTIRDDNGKLVAFFDRRRKTLDIDGVAQTLYKVEDDAHAMDLVNEHYKPA